MNKKNFEIYFDFGSSKIRAGAFNKSNPSEKFYAETKFFLNHSNIDFDIHKIIASLEKNTNEYLDDINLMIDSPKSLSVGISVSKKLDGSKLMQEDVKFLIQEAKQQISKHYKDKNIVHIIISNYIIDDIEYTLLPDEIKCNLISMDIIFICLPKEIIEHFKKIFSKFEISINQIICSSYAKSINYKNNISSMENISFVDVGFNKTSITCYAKNKIIFQDILSIGGNHITKDISKVFKVDIEQAENMKLDFNKDQKLLMNENFSFELLQKVIFSRTEEILELCAKSIKLNSPKSSESKMVLMGEGSKIFHEQVNQKNLLISNVNILNEINEDICESGLKLRMGLNEQEVVIIPKKQIKRGFFENLFHFF